MLEGWWVIFSCGAFCGAFVGVPFPWYCRGLFARPWGWQVPFWGCFAGGLGCGAHVEPGLDVFVGRGGGGGGGVASGACASGGFGLMAAHPVLPGSGPIAFGGSLTGGGLPVIDKVVGVEFDIDVGGVFGCPGAHGVGEGEVVGDSCALVFFFSPHTPLRCIVRCI